MSANPEDSQRSTRDIAVSVIVPARNEQDCLGRCLASLSNQSGVGFEIILVNDHSTDATREIANRYAEVHVIDADDLPSGWTGKNHAVFCGARVAKGKWLLLTDADTVHRHGSLRHAVHEAERFGVDLLSYSPRQEVHSFFERILMPLVFAELRRQYPPNLINSSHASAAAANGQYLLISREAYDAIGGQTSVKDQLLEDVELAKLVKRSGRRLRFRYGGDAVTTRMYRSFDQLWEGWSKNLALLFPSPIKLASWRALEFLVGCAALGLLLDGLQETDLPKLMIGLLLGLSVATAFFRRVRKAHFGWLNTTMSFLGLPFFTILLVNSRLNYYRKRVTWKGRTYHPNPDSPQHAGRKIQESSSIT